MMYGRMLWKHESSQKFKVLFSSSASKIWIPYHPFLETSLSDVISDRGLYRLCRCYIPSASRL